MTQREEQRKVREKGSRSERERSDKQERVNRVGGMQERMEWQRERKYQTGGRKK